MKILEMAIKLYQRPVFCKWLNYITLIYNHKIYNHKRAHILETIKIKYLIYPQVRYSKQAKKMFFAGFGNYSKRHP